MAAKYPPYVNAYGNISKLFDAIKSASVPPKFTNNFMETSLGLKSSSYRAMIPLLKRIGFIDQANVPLQAYKDFRDNEISGSIMEERLKDAYSDLFRANEYAYKLKKDELSSKLITILGVSADDKNIPAVVNTFLELIKLAEFDGKPKKKKKREIKPLTTVPEAPLQQIAPPIQHEIPSKFGISYTINLNLPATTEIEVFNAIFKSLKEHILDEK